jgi:ABC-type lipoprotein release transport system permease subunit
MLISLAWKNIWRNKSRSLVVVLAIAFGLWGGLFSDGLMVGMGESMVNTAIDRDLAHIQIHRPDYDETKGIRRFIPQGLVIADSIRRLPHIVGVSARTRFTGIAFSASSSYPVQISGIVPTQEKKVTRLYEKIKKGTYFGTKYKNAIVIGAKLAKRLKLHIHSKIVLGFEGTQGELINIACRVVGIFQSGSSIFDESNVFLKQDYLSGILGGQTLVHEIAIRCDNSHFVGPITSRLKARYPKLLVQSWQKRNPLVAFTSSLMIEYSYLFLVFILLAVLFGITNTMLMSVVDRIKELGMLMAIGMKQTKIFIMILLESLFLSLTGGVAGIILGALTIALTRHHGIDLSVFRESLESFGASAVIYPTLPLEMYFTLTILIIITANIAGFLPAWKAIRLQPAEAIRSV